MAQSGPVKQEEAALLTRCRAGEEAAWSALFDFYHAPASRFVFQLGYQLSVEDVEEICQETFLSVVRNLKQFKGQCQFQTWLFRIAWNKARDFSQHRRAAKRGGGVIPLPLHGDEDDDTPPLDPPSPLPSPNAALIHSENLSLVGRALQQLRAPHREILELRYFGDLSYEEISRCLDLHPKTVSSRLSKARDKLEIVLNRLWQSREQPLAPAWGALGPYPRSAAGARTVR